jgi:indolepyruvate ferredoxin oxidoreductase beta subunit
MLNVVISGVGGQCTVSVGHILSQACLELNIPFVASETHGMSQRGGSVVFHLRICRSVVAPVIGKGQADIILAGEPMEALRVLEFLKPNGMVITSTYGILSPISNQLGQKYPDLEKIYHEITHWPAHLFSVETERIVKEIGNEKVTNIILLGKLLAMDEFPITLDQIKELVGRRWPKVKEDNVKALEIGHELAEVIAK